MNYKQATVCIKNLLAIHTYLPCTCVNGGHGSLKSIAAPFLVGHPNVGWAIVLLIPHGLLLPFYLLKSIQSCFWRISLYLTDNAIAKLFVT